MDPERLAALLAERFDAIVPVGFHVWADGDMLWYSADSTTPRHGGQSGTNISGNLDNGDTMEERVARCAETALSQLQDFVNEESAEPWPGDRTVPSPHAEVVGDRLLLWFGDAKAPVLECEPVNLT